MRRQHAVSGLLCRCVWERDGFDQDSSLQQSTTRFLVKTAAETVNTEGAVGSATSALAYTTIPSEMIAPLQRLAEESGFLPSKKA